MLVRSGFGCWPGPGLELALAHVHGLAHGSMDYKPVVLAVN